MDKEYFAKYRAMLSGVDQCTFVNSGAVGPLAKPIYKKVLAEMDEQFSYGGIVPPALKMCQDAREELRREIAAFINAEPEEIALFRSVSESFTAVDYLIPAEAGDEFLISTQENHAVVLAAFAAARHEQYQIKKFAAEGSKEEVIASFRENLSDKTRLATFSHVTHTYGARMPVKELCAEARKRGVYTAIDGAQAVATTPIDVKEIGCDFYAFCTHKWMGGVEGVSALYVRDGLMKKLTPAFAGTGAQKSFDFENNTLEFQDTARCFEFGARNSMICRFTTEGIRFAKEIGLENIYARQHELNRYARAKVREEIPDAIIYSPDDEERMTGIFTVGFPGIDAKDLVAAAWKDAKIAIHPRVMDLIKKNTAVRISLNWFNKEEEVDTVVRYLKNYYEENGGKN